MTFQEALVGPHRARLRVADYMLLADAGAFDRYARTELIEGEIWVMNAAYSRHAKAQSRLDFALRSALAVAGLALEAFAAPSIALHDESMPEPDLVLADDHDDGPLPLAKVRLIIEVADATLDTDLGRKAALYARAGIPEYWVADVNARVIHQMWSLHGEAYAERREVAFGERIAAVTVAELVVETDGL